MAELQYFQQNFSERLKRNPADQDALSGLGLCEVLVGQTISGVSKLVCSVAAQPSSSIRELNLAAGLGFLGFYALSSSSLNASNSKAPRAQEVKGDHLISLTFDQPFKPSADGLDWFEHCLKSYDNSSESVNSAASKVQILMSREWDALREGVVAPGWVRFELWWVEVLQRKNQLNELTLFFKFCDSLGIVFFDRLRRLIDSLYRSGHVSRATGLWELFIAMRVGDAECWIADSLTYAQRGEYRQARSLCDKALARSPFDLCVLTLGAELAFRERNFEAALNYYDRLISQVPESFDAKFGRASTLLELRRPKEAIGEFEGCLKIKPGSFTVFVNRGTAYLDSGEFTAALADFEEAIQIEPNHPTARYNRALIFLAQEEFSQGFSEYEWGWANGQRGQLRYASIPRLPNTDFIKGRRVLIHAEQGLGDTIQFCRFIDPLVQSGAEVVFDVPAALFPLIKGSFQDLNVVSGVDVSRMDFEYQCPLMSLPTVLAVGASDLVQRTPYLRVQPQRVERHKKILDKNKINIGICSQGRKGVPIDVGRSFPITLFSGIASMASIDVYCLSKRDSLSSSELIDCDWVNLLPAYFDTDGAFIDTAALICSLDLIVTSDTAIAHLAGALGRPVWVVLKKVPDWRWGLNRSDSLWYPTMRLFRQQVDGDWSGPLNEIRAELSAKVVHGVFLP